MSFESLAAVFDAWNVSPDRISAVLAAKANSTSATRRDKLLRSIFSSAIDADKIDYLTRDASHTGVPYPLGMDTDRLLRTLTVVIVNDSSSGVRDVPFIGVHAKGKIAAEFLILARYAMFAQVYWHHAVRAQKAMLSRAVGALLSTLETDEAIDAFRSDFVEMVARLPESLYHKQEQLSLWDRADGGAADFGGSGAGTDIAPTDAAVLSWLRNRLWAQKLPEARLIDAIASRTLFKRLWIVSHDMAQERWSRIVEAWDQLNRSQRNKVGREYERRIQARLTPERAVSVTAMKASDTIEIIQEKTQAEIPWLLIDVPGGRPGSDIALHYVLEGQRRQLRKNDQAVGELQACSVWHKYAKDLRQAAGKIRVYCDRKLVDAIEASISADDGLAILEEAITEGAA